tara:strand:+ start:6357 stop:7139 length:783 start_codon:yes stop_codon:yes gene_type:complete
MDFMTFLMTVVFSLMVLIVLVVMGCREGIQIILFFFTLFIINIFFYFHEYETTYYSYVDKFELSQNTEDFRKIDIFSGKDKGREIYFNLKRGFHLYEKKENEDISFIVDIDYKHTYYSFNPVNNKGKIEIGYPKNFICLKESLFQSYSKNQNVEEIFDVSETEKTYINKSFVDLEKINKLNTGNIELIFKINKYESYSLLLKDKDNIKVTKSDENNITGLLYTKNNRRQIDNCFTQKVEIFIENEEAYQKLNNLIFYNYH